MPCAIFSTDSSSDRGWLRIAAVVLLCALCPAQILADSSRIAVFPPVDRTGRSAPTDDVLTALETALSARGFTPVPRSELEEFYRRHRTRYTGGVSAETALAIGVETRAEGIILTSVDDWDTVSPPRFAVTCRWVAADAGATIAWMETSAHHGDERPGLFGLGLVTSPATLITRAADEIADSLAASDRGSRDQDRPGVPRRFRPGSLAVDPDWAGTVVVDHPLRVAVLPFVVDTAQRDLGNVLADHFMRWLRATGRMIILEPGVVREALLDARVIQEDGPSLPQGDALRALLELDLIVSGRVTDYEAMGSAPGSPFLGFSASAIDLGSRQVVWSSFSFGRGDDRIGMFGTARIRSSVTLLSGLVQGAVGALDEVLSSRAPVRAAIRKEENR